MEQISFKNIGQNNQPSFTADVSISFITTISIFMIAVVTGIITARALGPLGKGIYALVIMIPALAASLISMGINFSNVYFIGKNKYPINLILGNSIFYAFIFGGGLTIVLMILVPFLAPAILKNAPSLYFYFTLPMIPFLLIIENIVYIFLGYREMHKFAMLRLSQPLTYLVLLLILAYLSRLNVLTVIVVYIFGVAINLLLGTYFIVKEGYLRNITMNRVIFADALGFGLKQHLATIFQFLNYRLDILIIAVLLSPFEVGLYSVSFMVAETIWYIPNSLGQILYPQTVSSDTATADKFTPLVCRNSVLLTFIGVCVLFVISGFLIPLFFTQSFLPSVRALKLLLPGIFFLSISKILGSDLVGRGFPIYNSYATFISLVLTVIFDFLLIPRFGINGASVASSIAYTANTLVIIYFFKKKSGTRLTEIFFIKRRDFYIYRNLLRYIKR